MTGRLEAVVQAHAPDDYDERIRDLQFRLYQLLVAYHRLGHTALILVEGWDAAGKGGLIRRMTSELDPRFVKVVPIAAPNEWERGQHYLERFWRQLPPTGNWTVFDRTWYGRVLVERVEGLATKAEWSRAYAEINATEAMLTANGMRLVKLFLHVDEEEQNHRLLERMQQPWKRWKVTAEDFRNIRRRGEYLEAYEEMFGRTDTAHAPWTIIGSNHKKAARIAAMTAVVDRLSHGVDVAAPPLDPELRRTAEKLLGRKVTAH